ncbi:MAG: recombinase family protein [Clostridia bacterium]|nr:recombinase family protein [Clostridia bacterium]
MRNLTDIYVRLSDEDRDKRCKQDESESIQNQKSMLINYCIEQGWQIHNILCDEDYSGADRERPAFNQMLKDCEEGKVDIVLCKTQSRFSRDMEIVEKYIHGKFLEWNVRFVSIVDHADTSVAGNKKARQINGLINEWYLEDLSDNIRRTLKHKKLKGEYCCPYAPYGYKLNPDDKHKFIIDPPAAEVVRSIFEMYKQGMGYMRIAKTLNEKQILPPAVYKEMQGLNYRNPNAENTASRQWRDSSIYYILRQEVYTGAVVQGKSKNLSYKNKKRVKLPKSEWIVVPDMHEPIIDKDLWNTVQNLLKSRQGNDKKFKSESKEINPLRGIVHCKECGSGMWRMSYQSGENRYKYYRCRTVKNSEGICDNINSIRQIDLEDLILKELQKLSDIYFDETQISLQQKQSNRISAMEEERKQLEKKIAKIQNNSVQLYKDKLSGLINDGQFKILNDNFNSEVNQHNKRLELIEKEMERLSGEKQNSLSREAILSKYKNTEKLTFELVHELIEGVYVGKINPETHEREIEIHWKF